VVNERNGKLAASFPLGDNDQIMLVTNGGKLIRCPVGDIRIAGRNTQGVRIFRTDDEESVVSVERIRDVEDESAELGEADVAEGGEAASPPEADDAEADAQADEAGEGNEA